MSIFSTKDIDIVLITYCDLIDDYTIIKKINKYYYQLITNLFLYKSLMKLILYKRINFSKHNDLFIYACKTNNILYLYLIRKFVDINIHAKNNCAFRLSCENGHLDVAQWLINLSKQSNFSLINIHADNERVVKIII